MTAPKGRVPQPSKPKPLPVPDPPNVWDTDLIEEGPNRMEIAKLLEETTDIAVVDWKWRKLYDRRMEIWLRLRELGVTQARMSRAYAVNGRSIITPTAITLAFRRHDNRLRGRPIDTSRVPGASPAIQAEPEEAVVMACWCGAQQVPVPKSDADAGTTRSCGERICHPPLAQEEA
jgi:hypothetical protein